MVRRQAGVVGVANRQAGQVVWPVCRRWEWGQGEAEFRAGRHCPGRQVVCVHSA